MENKRQKIEIADIFSRFESEYYQQYHMIPKSSEGI